MAELGRHRWVNVQEAVQGCVPTKQVSGLGAPLMGMAHQSWTEHPAVLEFERRTAVGRRPFRGPLLIISGTLDSVTDIKNLRETINDTCKALRSSDSPQGLHFAEYTGLNHCPVIQASQSRWLGWARLLFFSGGDSETGCVKETIEGFRGEGAMGSTFPNFILETAGGFDIGSILCNLPCPRNRTWQSHRFYRLQIVCIVHRVPIDSIGLMTRGSGPAERPFAVHLSDVRCSSVS